MVRNRINYMKVEYGSRISELSELDLENLKNFELLQIEGVKKEAINALYEDAFYRFEELIRLKDSLLARRLKELKLEEEFLLDAHREEKRFYMTYTAHPPLFEEYYFIKEDGSKLLILHIDIWRPKYESDTHPIL